MATWHSALPQVPFNQGYIQAQDGNNVLRSQMGYGPPKVRRRTTASLQDMPITMPLTEAQRDALIVFYETTLEGGVLPFDWTDPLTGSTVEFQFSAPIAWSKPNGIWMAQMQLKILP